MKTISTLILALAPLLDGDHPQHRKPGQIILRKYHRVDTLISEEPI